MNINGLNGTIAPKKAEGKQTKLAIKPEVAKTEEREILNEQGAKALKNYFIGAQNVPSFKGYPCSTGEFNHNMVMVPCACCGKKMISGNENVDKLAKKLTGIKGEERVNFIDDTMDLYRPVEKTIMRGMKEYTKKYPEKTTFNICSEMAKHPQEILKNGQMAVLDDVDKKATELYGEENKVSKFIKTQRPLLNGEEVNPNFDRATFIKKMDEITTNLKDEKAKGKVLNVAIDMPFEEDYYKKMTNKIYKPAKFIRSLFSNAIKTAEHIHPKSKGGPNNTENYMSECNECNENRQNYNLNNYWMTRYPSMPYNVQNFCDDVTNKIINGDIGPHFVDYPKDLKVAVENETQGAIKLTVLNPEEINEKRKEKGLEPIPEITQANLERARSEANSKDVEDNPVPKPRKSEETNNKKVA